MNIINLFPTLAVIDNIGREFTKEEHDVIERLERVKNTGNHNSKDSYVFEHSLQELKKLADQKIKEYATLRYAPSRDVEFYITQSWLNWTKPGEVHHAHYHQNSLISGVIYINAKEDDRIFFHKKSSPTVKIETKDYNPYNSDSWWVPVKTGDIILFPSDLSHEVEPVTHDETRISLAFNVWVRGSLGTTESLNELIL
jgi:uncharacterized protein (TIGR02466 family)